MASFTETVITQRLRSLRDRGLFHIFGANLINKVALFATNILIARFLKQDGYGLFSYAYSTYSIVNLFSGFGLISGMLQYGSEDRDGEEKLSYFRYGLTRGIAIDSIIAVIMILFGLSLTFPIGDVGSFISLFGPLILLDYLFQFFQVVFRSRKDNRSFAVLTNVNTLSYTLFGCVGARWFGILGTIVGRYIAYCVSAFFAICVLRNEQFGLFNSVKLGKEQASELWNYSISTGASSIMNQLTFQLDVFIVGNVVANPVALAEYRVATMIPEGLLFIPSCVIIFVLPYFAERNKDLKWVRNHSRVVYLAIEALMIPLFFLLFFSSKTVITLLWGPDYLGAVIPFKIMCISMLISPLRSIGTNLLAALRETKANLIVSIVTLLSNLVITTISTLLYGSTGAAVAVTCVTGIASVASMVLLERKTRSCLEE